MKHFLQAARSIYGKMAPIYILQCDVSKFFSSVSWDVLLSQIERYALEPRIFVLIQKIITTHKAYDLDGKLCPLPQDVISIEKRQGLPIGNLTSQLFANVYLNPLDHFVKDCLRERWYGRYMDDFFILGSNAKHLQIVREQIRSFLSQKLRLSLHPRKVTINTVSGGVAFLGYRIFYDHVLIRGNTLARFQKKYHTRQKKVERGITPQYKLKELERSFRGHLQFADSYGLATSLFGERTEE